MICGEYGQKEKVDDFVCDFCEILIKNCRNLSFVYLNNSSFFIQDNKH